MTPERAAALVRKLAEALTGYADFDHRGKLVELRVLEPWVNDPSVVPGEYLRAIDDAARALTEVAALRADLAKAKERTGALGTTLRRIRTLAAHATVTTRAQAFTRLNQIDGAAASALVNGMAP